MPDPEVAQDLKSRSQFQNPMEPIISKLAQSYVDGDDLRDQLHRLFRVRVVLGMIFTVQ